MGLLERGRFQVGLAMSQRESFQAQCLAAWGFANPKGASRDRFQAGLGFASLREAGLVQCLAALEFAILRMASRDRSQAEWASASRLAGWLAPQTNRAVEARQDRLRRG